MVRAGATGGAVSKRKPRDPGPLFGGCMVPFTPAGPTRRELLTPKTPAGRDPFRIDGPALVHVSGGRTSAMMLRRIIDAHGGTLPADVIPVFANTGREREETLRFVEEFATRWGVTVRWVERDGTAPVHQRFHEVDYDSASRNGEPFEELIRERRFLPNSDARICTQALKIETAADFARSLGWDEHEDVIGLRGDEPQRVHDLRLKAMEKGDRSISLPLYDARVSKADVAAFWAAQPFDLRLQPWESNCDGCFLRSIPVRARLAADHPERFAWWVEMERLVSEMTGTDARFRAHQPAYRVIAERVRLQVVPPEWEADAASDEAVCGRCTDRRRVRCDCRRRLGPGRGHTLACPVRGVWAGEVAA